MLVICAFKLWGNCGKFCGHEAGNLAPGERLCPPFLWCNINENEWCYLEMTTGRGGPRIPEWEPQMDGCCGKLFLPIEGWNLDIFKCFTPGIVHSGTFFAACKGQSGGLPLLVFSVGAMVALAPPCICLWLPVLVYLNAHSWRITMPWRYVGIVKMIHRDHCIRDYGAILTTGCHGQLPRGHNFKELHWPQNPEIIRCFLIKWHGTWVIMYNVLCIL